MTPWFQYRDPLVGVLDYIVEVRLPWYDQSLLSNSPSCKRNVLRMGMTQTMTTWTRTTWPLRIMMIFGLSKTWYVSQNAVLIHL